MGGKERGREEGVRVEMGERAREREERGKVIKGNWGEEDENEKGNKK